MTPSELRVYAVDVLGMDPAAKANPEWPEVRELVAAHRRSYGAGYNMKQLPVPRERPQQLQPAVAGYKFLCFIIHLDV